MMTVSLLGAMASCSDMEVAEVNGRYPEVITATIAEPDGQAQSRTCVDMCRTRATATWACCGNRTTR